tara:strand:- start:130 stop:1095 length:966 start_codon:yes stop_codon:yes gene_type:complete
MNISSIHEKHNLRFCWITIIFLGIFTSHLSEFFFDGSASIDFFNNPSSFLSIICLFLILTIGISHGALDNLKGYKLLKFYKIRNKAFFYLIYSFIAVLIASIWFFFPSIVLTTFLIFAAYHFGKEDCSFVELKPSSINSVKFFFKGSLIISLPLFCKFDETLEIFKSLYIENDIFFNTLISFDNKNIFLYLVLISFLTNFFVSKNNRIILVSESFVLLLLNLSTAPLVAFTIYFCFLHSIRHSISLAHELNTKNFKAGLKDFFNKVLPLTVFTAIAFIICLFVLQKYYSLNDAVLKVIFIGLASLTFPHILLEYLIEKNEK